jgi:hypothetical protein
LRAAGQEVSSHGCEGSAKGSGEEEEGGVSDNDDWKIKVDLVFWIVSALVVLAFVCIVIAYVRGDRHGRCTEMCRPAQFDSAQEVNGGCLCIGSDKVLRFKEVP